MIKKPLKNNLFIILLVLFFCFIWIYFFLNFSTIWAQDSFWYIRLSENLREGKGYSLEGAYPHGQYPPGLPFIIVISNIFIRNIFKASLIMILLLSVSSIIIAYLIGREINEDIGLISATILAFHNLFIFFSLSIMTEIPFLFFSTLGLYLFMKSYENRNLIIPSAISLSFSALIRYDGLLLIFPIAFYIFIRKKEIENFFFCKKTLIALGISILIIGSWFLRNLIVFGNSLPNMHSKVSTNISIMSIYEFSILFFKTGYFFSILAILGIFFSLIKLSNKKEIRVYVIWLLTYFLLHSWWWAKTLRFYTEVIIILSILSSIGIFFLADYITKKESLKKILIVLLVLIVIIEQLFILFYGNPEHETTFYTLNRYDPIKQISEYATQNLPNDAVLVAPEWVVYTTFIKDRNILSYEQGFNYLLSSNETIYLFTDNLHPWLIKPYYPKNGKIRIDAKTKEGDIINIEIYAEEIKTFDKKIKNNLSANATLWKIEGYTLTI